ncbi:MAG: hypothetical protein Hals2KO_02430 [Halioglobus sp.]
MLLHTLSSPPASSVFTDCLRCVDATDAVLLLGDGVYAALPGSEACRALRDCGAEVYVLRDCASAAGIDSDSHAFQVLTMDEFVALTERFPRSLAWY